MIVPVFNEKETIPHVIDRLKTCGIPDLEIIIVDDCSTDGTTGKLATLAGDGEIILVKHEKNQGKGAAIRTAQTYVSGDAVVIQDADLEYDPAELPKLFRIIEMDRADVVYGSRYSGSGILVDTFWHYMGNKMLTTLSNILSNLHLTDMETCYKMVRADIFKELKLECDRFGIEPELTAKLARRHCRIYEIPISYQARKFDQGKKIGWKDGLAAVWYIFKYNLFRS